jgi:hypothetical protein
VSGILDTARDYHAGKIDENTLVRILSLWPYRPVPKRPAGATEDAWEADPFYVDGTFDEVKSARNMGLIPQPVFLRIAKAAWDVSHPAASTAGGAPPTTTQGDSR